MTVRAEQIRLRPVGAADDAFILLVYASTRANELQQVPWTPEQKDAFVKMQFTAQKQHYAASFPRASHDVICLDEIAVGRIYVDRKADCLHILDITILPQYRNQGIGSELLRQLLDEAGQSGKAVTIYVETFNPSVRFFERLGFQKDREIGFQFLLKREPAR
ncbi:MAG TPA: GNAT family N-acetyltransferase [Candidatus Angelobacter sp.]|nr:GNAT family N-acetyltransferase [Candidatus Angelobacter sp.]